jgi:hypothetical protein
LLKQRNQKNLSKKKAASMSIKTLLTAYLESLISFERVFGFENQKPIVFFTSKLRGVD